MGLAPPTPYQWQVGDIGSASLLNAQLYNGLTFLEGPPIFWGVQTVNQSLAATNVAILFDTNIVDTYGGHSVTTNTSRYTAQIAGYHDICGCVGFVGNATGGRAAKIYYNGSVIQGSNTEYPNAGALGTTITTPVVTKFLNVGDYVEVYGWQNSGGSLSTTASFGDQACSFWVRYSHT